MANQPQGLLPLQGELQNVFFFVFFAIWKWNAKYKITCKKVFSNDDTFKTCWEQLSSFTDCPDVGHFLLSVMDNVGTTLNLRIPTSAAAGLSVIATDTSPCLESLDMGPKVELKNIEEGSVLISCSLICEPREWKKEDIHKHVLHSQGVLGHVLIAYTKTWLC